MCWFQLPKWKDLLLFFVLWDSKRTGFGFWTVSRTKRLHVKTSLWAIWSCDEHLPRTLKKDSSGVLMRGCVKHLSLVSASPAAGDRQLSPLWGESSTSGKQSRAANCSKPQTLKNTYPFMFWAFLGALCCHWTAFSFGTFPPPYNIRIPAHKQNVVPKEKGCLTAT